MPSKQLLSGSGWRLGYMPDAEVFVGLVGGDRWAVELTSVELRDFCRLSLELAEAMHQMQQELSDQEKLTCESETEHLYIEVAGYPDEFSLYFRLSTGRNFEGSWPEDVVPDLLESIDTIQQSLI